MWTSEARSFHLCSYRGAGEQAENDLQNLATGVANAALREPSIEPSIDASYAEVDELNEKLESLTQLMTHTTESLNELTDTIKRITPDDWDGSAFSEGSERPIDIRKLLAQQNELVGNIKSLSRVMTLIKERLDDLADEIDSDASTFEG